MGIQFSQCTPMSQCTPKNNSDQTITVRETGVSRHQGGQIEGPPDSPRTSQYYRIEGIKGVPDGQKEIKNSFLSVLTAN